jgi:hypothetical protein
MKGKQIEHHLKTKRKKEEMLTKKKDAIKRQTPSSNTKSADRCKRWLSKTNTTNVINNREHDKRNEAM